MFKSLSQSKPFVFLIPKLEPREVSNPPDTTQRVSKVRPPGEPGPGLLLELLVNYTSLALKIILISPEHVGVCGADTFLGPGATAC